MLENNSFKIITDSSADFSDEMCKELNICEIPLSVSINGEVYKDYPDEREITRKEFYKILREKKMGHTSAPNVSDFYCEFEKVLKEKKDVLYIALSSGLSATYSNAKIAAAQVKDVYPENKIFICDSLCASLGQGLLVYFAVKKKELGYSIDEVFDFLEREKHHICHFFTVGDLYHLQRGGRIPKFTAVAGSILNIKPILHMDNNGKLVKLYNIRGRKNSVEELFNNLKKSIVSTQEQTIFISHGDCEQDAILLKNIIKESFKPKTLFINTIGPVIGMHSGPDTLALFFLGNLR